MARDGILNIASEAMVLRERAADRWVHIAGVLLGTVGAALLLTRAAAGSGRAAVPLLVYASGLIAMLYCSAAYNLGAGSAHRPLLRRLDHAAIFVMIAGTYTPFLARNWGSGNAAALLVGIWAVAIAGAIAKLTLSKRFEAVSIVAYLALGWAAVASSDSLTATLDWPSTQLLIAGGALYSIGVGSYLWRTLPYHNAIWHVFVLAAAGCHYAAVLRIAT
jgi:hemolysin III